MTGRKLLVLLAVWSLVAVAGFGAGATTYGQFSDSVTGGGTISAAEQFVSFPDGAVAYSDNNPTNGQYDDGETTYTPEDLANLGGDQRLRFPESIASVSAETVDTDTQTFITGSSVTFVTDFFDIRTYGGASIQNSNIEASDITVAGGGQNDLTGAALEATTVTLTNDDHGTVFEDATIDADDAVTVEGYGSPILGTEASIEAGNSLQLSANGNEIDLHEDNLEAGNWINITANGGSIDLRNADLEAGNPITITARGGSVDLRGANCDAPEVVVKTSQEYGSC